MAHASGEASLRVLTGQIPDTEIPLPDTFEFGRSAPEPGNLGGDPEVSRSHARITRMPDGAFSVEDLGSVNGTYLNGWKIQGPQILRDGDRLQIGGTVLAVSSLRHDAPTVLRKRSVVLDAVVPEEPPQVENALLYVRGVRKSYGELEVLKGVDLEIRPGEIVGLLGANGAGKTSLVSIIAGLRAADAGTVQINGVDALAHPREAGRFLGIAPQDLGIYPTMTVRSNLRYAGEIEGKGGPELDRRVEELAELVGLAPKLDAKSGAMSGGQQRRLHTAMAIVPRPPLLILDEPTVGADVRSRQQILDLVRTLADDGHGICYSTHYLPEIESLGASVAILQGGRIIARGSLAELITAHGSQAVELHFDGPAPDLDLGAGVTREGAVLRLITDKPTTGAAELLARLGPHAVRLREVEMIRPSLESVYLTLTERRYSEVIEVPAEMAAVGAPGGPVLDRRTA